MFAHANCTSCVDSFSVHAAILAYSILDMATITDAVHTRLQTAQSILQSCKGTARHQAVSSVQRHAVMELLDQACRDPRWNSSVCAEIMDKVLKVEWVQADADAILQKLSDGASRKVSRRQQQDFRSIAAFFTDAQWDALQDPGLDLNGRADCMCNFAANMQCINPTEPTYKWWASMVIVLHFETKTIHTLSYGSKHALFQHIKTTHKRLVKKQVVDSCSYLTALPISPEELQKEQPAMFIKWFSQTRAGRNRLDERLTMQVDNSFTCRGGALRSMSQPAHANTAVPNMSETLAQIVPMITQSLATVFQQNLSGPQILDASFIRPAGRSLRALQEAPRRTQTACFADDGEKINEQSTPIAVMAEPIPVQKTEGAASTSSPRAIMDEPSATLPVADDEQPQERKNGNELLDALLLRESAKKTAAKASVPEDSLKTKLKAPSKKSKLPSTPPQPAKKRKQPSEGTPPEKKQKTPKPSIGHETTRNQYLCRTGLTGKGQYLAMPYGPGKKYANAKAAENAAKIWLEAQKAKISA